MTTEKAWDHAIGMIKVDGLEPTKDFKKYIELEKAGKATTEDLLLTARLLQDLFLDSSNFFPCLFTFCIKSRKAAVVSFLILDVPGVLFHIKTEADHQLV